MRRSTSRGGARVLRGGEVEEDVEEEEDVDGQVEVQLEQAPVGVPLALRLDERQLVWHLMHIVIYIYI